MNAGEIMKLRDANSWSLLAAVCCDKKDPLSEFVSVECEIELYEISMEVVHLMNRREKLLDTLQTLNCSDHHELIQLRDDNKLLRAKLEFLTGNFKASLNLSRSFSDMPSQGTTFRFKTLLAEMQFIQAICLDKTTVSRVEYVSHVFKSILHNHCVRGCLLMFTQIANFPSDKEFQIPQFAKAALKYLKLKSESYKDGAGKAIKSVEFRISQRYSSGLMDLRDKHQWNLLSDTCSYPDDPLKEFIFLECTVERCYSFVEVEEMKKLLEKLLILRGSEELTGMGEDHALLIAKLEFLTGNFKNAWDIYKGIKLEPRSNDSIRIKILRAEVPFIQAACLEKTFLARYEPQSGGSKLIRLLMREYYKKGCIEMFTQMANWSSEEVFRVPQFARSASKYINYESCAWQEPRSFDAPSKEFQVSDIKELVDRAKSLAGRGLVLNRLNFWVSDGFLVGSKCLWESVVQQCGGRISKHSNIQVVISRSGATLFPEGTFALPEEEFYHIVRALLLEYC